MNRTSDQRINKRPISEACERNKQPILAQLKKLLEQPQSVLEIGSGTGQHAAFFAEQLPNVTWHTSDLVENHPWINSWIESVKLDNLIAPFHFDVLADWPTQSFNAVFSANTLHIMPWEGVVALFQHINTILEQNGLLIVYGPFKYQGDYTSNSNLQFDQWLKSQHSYSGIRDFEAVNLLANKAKLSLEGDFAMPANNQLLVWRKN
ncbi:DUF938 domain-containing protein [Aliikangiella sp. IMCC44653]